MLTTLKAKMRSDVEFRTSLEAASEYISENNDDIKDIFLDDPDALIIGAENDPEIAKLVDSLPDDPDVEEVTAEDINNLVEGFIPETMLAEGMVTEGIEDGYEDDEPGDDDEDLDDDFDPDDFIDDVEEGAQADAYRARKEKEKRDTERKDYKKAMDRSMRMAHALSDDPSREKNFEKRYGNDKDADNRNTVRGRGEEYAKKAEDAMRSGNKQEFRKHAQNAANLANASERNARKHPDMSSYTDIDFEDLDDLMEADFDNILATKQDEVEDAADKTPTKSKPCEKNIDGEDQEDIEDASDKAPTKSSPCTKNIMGEDQDTIEDVGESFDDLFDFDDIDLVEEGEQADAYRARKEKEKADAEKADKERNDRRYENRIPVGSTTKNGYSNSDHERAKKSISAYGKERDSRFEKVMNADNKKDFDASEKEYRNVRNNRNATIDAANRHERRHGTKESFDDVDFDLDLDFDI